MDELTQKIKRAGEITHNIHLAYYAVAADKLGIKYEMELRGMLMKFTYGDKCWRFFKAITPLNNSVSSTLATFKSLTNKLLVQYGLPVPLQIRVKDLHEVFEFLKENNIQNYVVKPVQGFGGTGITIRPEGEKETEAAYHKAKEKSFFKGESNVLVEEFITGDHYRILVLGGKVIAAAQRIPATVFGDGKSTIRQLIEKRNEAYRAIDHDEIKIDDETHKALTDLGFTLDSVPADKQVIRTRFNCNMSQGGSTRECLSEVHPKYIETSIRATEILGLRIAGVDIITPDIKNPDVKFAINEINYDPGLGIHYVPDEGKPQEVAIPILEYIRDNA